MFIKIYFDYKPLFLCDDVDATLQPYVHHDDAVFIDELNLHTVKSMIHEMQDPSIHAGIFFHKDLEELKAAFFKKFTLIVAAGGFVLNEKDQVLMMFRRGKWDLPKGKLGEGEDMRSCALREVSEETGVRRLQIKSELMITYHTYEENEQEILKETEWFLMETDDNGDLQPQQDEDIEVCEWVQADNLQNYLKNTHPSVIDVMDKGMSLVTV